MLSKLKILHAALITSYSPGIENQMADEYDVINNSRITWDVKIYLTYENNNPSPLYHKNIIFKNILFNKIKLLNIIKVRFQLFTYFYWLFFNLKKYDIVILRYMPSSIIQFLFLLFSPKKIYFIHHTNEPEELKLYNGPTKKLNLLIENYIGPISIRLAKGTISVTNEIGKFELLRANIFSKRKFYLYPNGININKNLKSKILHDIRDNTPTLLFLSSVFYPWQGLDLLLEKLHNLDVSFKLHIVGDVYDDLKNKYYSNLNFKFHGKLNREEILKLSEESWVGVSSLALHRQGLTEACALKVREYLLMGLPVIGTYDEVLPNNFKFYKKIEINVDDLFESAHYFRNYSKNEIRDSSLQIISKESIMYQLCFSLQNDI
jgi:hypothetical protein